jgi:hypothetical protein
MPRRAKMPVYLKAIDKFRTLENFRSVLIVPCRFCPAASFAAGKIEPYYDFLRRFLKTASYEQYIETRRCDLGTRGVKVDAFKSRLPHQFIANMWIFRRRKNLTRRAMKYSALVVLGCEAAVLTIYDSVKSTPCKAFQGMKTEGIMSIQPLFHPPCNILLRLDSITPFLYQRDNHDPWIQL